VDANPRLRHDRSRRRKVNDRHIVLPLVRHQLANHTGASRMSRDQTAEIVRRLRSYPANDGELMVLKADAADRLEQMQRLLDRIKETAGG
jgi:hypothetical protein